MMQRRAMGKSDNKARTRRRSRLRRPNKPTARDNYLFSLAGGLLVLVFGSILLLSFAYLVFMVEEGPVLHPDLSHHTGNLPTHQKPIQHSLLRGPHADKSSPVESSDLQQQQQAVNLPRTVRKNESNVIDMRQLDYELPFDNPDGGAWKQGWQVQAVTVDANHPLTVYVVPHSHCDPGWIKTFDQYFQTQTKQILTTVIQALQKDARRKFIWAEISYFEWWWNEQNKATRQIVKQLLENGQLEFVTGGWVQPDEANSELYAMEIQLQEGHDWIQTTLGEQHVPHYGWSIDPFGYSPTMAWLLQKYGFRAMLIQRVHYAVKKELAQRQHLEFYWRQTWDEDGEHDIFTHVMPFYSYDVPHTCGPDPAVCCQFDFRRTRGQCPWKKDPISITAENVQERAMLLWDQYRKKAALYRSNTLLVPLGDDFRYQTEREAEAQYTNYQKIFDYLNANVPGAHVQFGTLSDYFQNVVGSFDAPILKGSFFTYSDVNQDYWSGYFTSRVFDKALDRQLERTLYAAQAMGGSVLELQQPRRALSLFQHHDGVTGTAKNHVVEDYAKRMYNAIHSTQDWMLAHLRKTQSQLLTEMSDIKACWSSDAPRGLSENLCGSDVILYNPLENPQTCGSIVVPGKTFQKASLPCELPGPLPDSKVPIVFDPTTGLMKEPVREEWMIWKVKKGGAYLFFPDQLDSFDLIQRQVVIEQGGYIVTTNHWKRRVVQRQVPTEFGSTATVIDFIYETNLVEDNREWFVRFSSDIANEGVFHTDLNGFNFDTHRFRSDMPIQSQVFPMPTLASIQDAKHRMTVLSEHAQGTASLQNGSIDVWLDRRLKQDDNRGLSQGVLDNRPTRTRFRVVLEEQESSNISGEFSVTPLGRRMWDELQHPLEMFGKHNVSASAKTTPQSFNNKIRSAAVKKPVATLRDIVIHDLTVQETVVPFVYMVYKRLDYLTKAIDSLRKSDFPKDTVPLIISHDGRVPEMVQYVESLQNEFNVIQLFHPFSCFEHPDSFPGDDKSLNEGFAGDQYGHPRSALHTCCKHHFTWLLKKVFSLDFNGTAVENFLFIEEDYVVAPTVYSTIVTGLNTMQQFENETNGGFIGVGLDPTGINKPEPTSIDAGAYWVKTFLTGPFTMNRQVFEKLQTHAADYCKFDDYNWDWSMVHLGGEGFLPHTLLLPSRAQARHIGVKDGMHAQGSARKRYGNDMETLETRFEGKRFFGSASVSSRKHKKGFGGWAHPADQDHCMKLLEKA